MNTFSAMAINSDTFKAEIAFLNRKLPNAKIKWEVRPALEQIISPALADSEVTNFIAQFKDILGKRAGNQFGRIIFAVSSKLQGGTRLVVSVKVLREYFADEIEGDAGGGGGRGYNPLSTRPTRGTGI